MNAPRRRVDVVVVGGGPAGTFAALRAGDLGAHTTLVTSGEFGGMAANDGPAPVRTLAHAARLLRDARQLGRYGVEVGEVVEEVRASSALRAQLEAAGVEIRERTGPVRFVDAHTIETPAGDRLSADRFILCPGGVSRRLSVPGAELCATHSDAWSLTSVPPSLLVIGAGATGVQVASVFHAFGARVQLFQAAARIIPTEEPEVSAAVAAAFRAADIVVHEAFGEIEAFEKTSDGVRMIYVKDGERRTAEAALAVLAVGWTADTAGLNLAAAGVATDTRGFIAVDQCLRTAAPHIWAAGDVTGGLMLAPQAIQAGFAAATNAVCGEHLSPEEAVSPIGSFTDPEYAQVGLTEARARERHDLEVVCVGYDAMTRAIIDGRTTGFCKLIVDRVSHQILGCHLVGERAVDIAQIAAVAMAGRMRVDELARVPLSFPTYAGILARAAATAARQLTRKEATAAIPPAVPA